MFAPILKVVTHKNPLKYLKVTKSGKLVAKLDNNVHTDDRNRVGIITFLLPWVSAKNPHNKELEITPTNAIALKIPFSAVVKFNSHATGNTNPIASVSRINAARIIPESTIKK